MTTDSVRSDRAARTARRPSGKNPGRFDPSLDAAILDAALVELSERGGDRMSMDDIASRARSARPRYIVVGPPSPRWSPMRSPIGESRHGPGEPPNTGSLARRHRGARLSRTRLRRGRMSAQLR